MRERGAAYGAGPDGVYGRHAASAGDSGTALGKALPGDTAVAVEIVDRREDAPDDADMYEDGVLDPLGVFVFEERELMEDARDWDIGVEGIAVVGESASLGFDCVAGGK